MKRIFSILLAIVTLAFTLNVGVAYHYCGGKLANSQVVVGHGLVHCGMDHGSSDCENHGEAISAIPCCQDQLIQFSTDEYQSSVSFAVNFAGFVPADVPALTEASQNISLQHLKRCNAPPGLTSVSLPVIGVFLI